ncbi:MAG: molecular chaperone DnaJ, partial [Muribaculaceae bacterium]
AALGGSVEVPTITGRARLTITAGTQPGKVLRLRGKGLANPETGGRGDQLVNVMVYVPEKLSDSDRKAIESLKDSPNFKPTDDARNRIFSKLRHIFE